MKIWAVVNHRGSCGANPLTSRHGEEGVRKDRTPILVASQVTVNDGESRNDVNSAPRRRKQSKFVLLLILFSF